MQTVNFCMDGKLWVNRNAGRVFYGYSPVGNGWALTEKTEVPQQDREYFSVDSALLSGDRLYTIEASGDLTLWQKCEYILNSNLRAVVGVESVPDFTYGIGMRNRDEGAVWTVTDFRASVPHGIYRYSELAVSDVYGNGICFLQDGSALVARYGQGHPGAFNGVPGALVYIPSWLLNP